MKYPCPECEHAATTVRDLKRHVRNKHKEVRYPCSECEFTSTTASYLKKHIENKHRWVRYPKACLIFFKQFEETDKK